MKVILRKVWRAYKDLLFRIKISQYQKRLPLLEQRIAKKEKIRIIFFVINMGMWKCDELFARLLADDRYEPFAMSFLYPTDSLEYRKYVQDDIKKHFEEKGYPFIACYNFDNNKWFDLRTFHPDIVFYAQPYNIGYEPYLIESLWDISLFAYIPYCFEMEDSSLYHHQFLQEIAWQMYYPTDYHKNMEKKYQYTKRDNIVVTGYPSADKLMQRGVRFETIWKKKDPSLKRVIWAPHHSLNGKDGINYSNFLELADDMILLAQKYSDKMQFGFKPHPRLKEKLYELQEWGIEKTDQYYRKWAEMDNTIFVEGQYDTLFITSDAMIHDSSTFMVEYMYTNRPVLFVVKENSNYPLNDFGKKCFDLHYQGKSIVDIDCFLKDVVLNGNDTKLDARKEFINQELISPFKKTVAENIHQAMNKTLFK